MTTNILLLAANPKGTSSLQLDEEMREIDRGVQRTEFGTQFRFYPKLAVRLKDLMEYLDEVKPDIIHFSGHGSKAAEIFLQEDDGSINPVSKEQLQKIFKHLKGNLKCVILNACYSEPQASAIAEDIDCVVGMLGEIEDKSAIDFARQFYRQLALGKDVTTAFLIGRAQVNNGENLARLLTYYANPSQIRFVQDVLSATPPEQPVAQSNVKVVINPSSPDKSSNTTAKILPTSIIALVLLVAGVVIGYLASGRVIPALTGSPAPTFATANTPIPFSPTALTTTPTVASTSQITDTTTTVPADTAILFTDDFEVNLNSWQGSSAPINAALVSPGYNNSKSAVEVSNDSDNSDIHRLISGNFIANHSYSVSVWCKAEARVECRLGFADLISNTMNSSYENALSQAVTGNGQWQPLSACKTMTNDDDMNVWLYARTTGSSVRYDNLQVGEVSQCATPTLPHTALISTFNFEENLDGWEKCYDNGCAIATHVESGHNSTHAVQVNYTDASHTGIFRHIGNVKAGDFYRVFGWCKARSGVRCKVVFNNLPNNDLGYDNGAEEIKQGNDEWQLLSMCKVMIKDARMSVHLYADIENSTVLYDDLQIEKVDQCP